MDGVVASPKEAAAIREACGPEFLIVTPGVRPAGSSLDDQKRVATPAGALQNGSSHIVVGRPITKAEARHSRRRACARSRPATRFTRVRRRVRPPNATSRARTGRYGRGCCRSTSAPASTSTATPFCRRPRRFSPDSRRTSRPTASVRSANCSTPILRSRRAEPFRRRGASRPCWTSTA